VKRLAVFDLDGTITRHDTLAPYVIGLLRKTPWQLLRIVRVVPALAAYAFGRIGRGELKARLLYVMLGDRTRAQLAAWTASFVPEIVARDARVQALRVIEAHRASGDVLVLLSASTDLYVPEIGAYLRFAEVTCTCLGFRAGHLDGTLTMPNRRGPEKTRCIERLRERYPGLRVVAYANAASDLDHLRQVDEAVLVNGSARVRRAAALLGIRSERWQ